MNHFGVMAFGSRLKRLSDYLFAEVEAIYKAHGIGFSPTHFPILMQLSNEPSLTVVELADRLGLSHPAISKQINKLVKEGWVIKKLDQDDNRRLFISLSEKGVNEMKNVAPILDAIKSVMEREAGLIDSRFLHSFEEYESKLLTHGLQKWVNEFVENNEKSIVIKAWDASYKEEFKALNMSWLRTYFPNQIQEDDSIILDNPQSEILAKGGYIWVATLEGKCVGVCALVPDDNRSYRVIKLAVEE
ncbi:MAG: MarR family winged helix-turn-helix transcriptional regulator, partial [Marinomonas sp.]